MLKNNEDIFMLAEHGGVIPAGNRDGFGLYYHDGYEVRVAGTVPSSLVSSAQRGSAAEFELTNAKLQVDGHVIPEQTFGLNLQRAIDSRELAVHDVFTVHNYDLDSHQITVSLCFQSSFENIFEIRGLHPKKVGRANNPQWQDGVLVLGYTGGRWGESPLGGAPRTQAAQKLGGWRRFRPPAWSRSAAANDPGPLSSRAPPASMGGWIGSILSDDTPGARSDAFGRKLRVVRPVLPKGIADLELKRIKVGNASVDCI